MSSAQTLEYDYELCETCEKAMEDAGLVGYTTEEMFKNGHEFAFDLAFNLLLEGHYIVRKAEIEKQFPKVIGLTHNGEEENLACIDPVTDTVTTIVQLSNQEILASDWTIAKLNQDK